MAVLTRDINLKVKVKPSIDAYLSNAYHKGHGYSVALNNFAHSVIPAESYNVIRPSIQSSLSLHNTKESIELLKKFNSLCAIHEGYSFLRLKREFSKVIFELVSLPFDDITFSLTYENSAFFIMRTNSFEFHLNYFFDTNPFEEDDEEAILLSYQLDEKLPSISGEFDFVINHLKNILTPEPAVCFWEL